MKTTLAKLQEGLNIQRRCLAQLEAIQHIDNIDLKDYWLRDARKIADALWLQEHKSLNWKDVTWFTTPGEYEYWKDTISITWWKPYNFSECSIIKIYLRVHADVVKHWEIRKESFTESFELGDSYGQYKKRSVADCIETQKNIVAEYEKAIATYSEFEAKEKEWTTYYNNASYLLH